MAPPYRTGCYALAIIHTIGATIGLLLATVDYSHLEETIKMAMKQLPPEQATQKNYDDAYKMLAIGLIMTGVVSVLQIFVGVLCIIGINKQLPHYVRGFRINAIVCLVIMGVGVLTSIGNPSRLLPLFPSIAFFGAEVWAAGKYYDFMVKETRQKGNNAGPNQAMLA